MPRPPLELSRRRALGALSVPVCTAAGCLESLHFGDGCSDPTHFSLQAVTEGSHATNEFCEVVESLPHGTEAVVSTATETGDATVRDYYAPELRKQYVVSGPTERFFRVTTSDSDPATVTGVEYAVEIGTDGSADDDGVRTFDSLPELDRESIRRALGNEHLLDAPHYDSFSVVFAPEDAADRERSTFVPAADDVRVKWDDHLLRFASEGTRSVTLTTTTIVAERVADTSRDFFEHVFDEHGVELDSLSSEQRSVVEDAIADGVTECPPHSAAFAALVDRLVIADGEIAWLVGYDGNRYFTHISASPDELR